MLLFFMCSGPYKAPAYENILFNVKIVELDLQFLLSSEI